MNKKSYLIIAVVFGIPVLTLAYMGGFFLRDIYLHEQTEFSTSDVQDFAVTGLIYTFIDIAVGIFLYVKGQKKKFHT